MAYDLRRSADEALSAAPQQKKLILIHAGITAAASLLASLLSLFLEKGIAQTGGLAGMGMRTLLSTGQSMLSLALTVLLPFWAAGYTASMLRIARGEETDSAHLLLGFRHFRPFLRLQILTALLSFAAMFLCFQVGSVLLSFTPLADALYAQLLPLLESDPATLDPAAQQQILEAGIPVLIAMGVLCLGVLIPLSYFLRLATLRLLDAPKQGARAAVGTSIRLMRGNCLRLFRLDLGFWWFYLAQLGVLALAWCDYLLPAVGVNLPFSQEVAYFLFYTLSLACQFALFCFCRNRVEVTYARFYLELLPKETENANENPVL